MDATLARIDAVLAEPVPDPPCLPCAQQALLGAPPCSAHPRPLLFGRDAASKPIDAAVVAAFAIAQRCVHGGTVVAETPAAIVTVPARKYVTPPADTRPGWLGWLRRRLIGEPPQ